MCDQSLPDIPINLHHPTQRGFTQGSADPCIAPLVQALNDGGFQTVASCCGHGRRPGNIVLEDDRVITIETFEEWEETEAFLRGHLLLHVPLERWHGFLMKFLDRYRKAKEIHALESQLLDMARLRAVFAPINDP